MTNLSYMTPKLEILLSGHYHKLQNLQDALKITILNTNLVQYDTQFWNKVNSIKLKLKELIFCYTVALKILNELCFNRKCLEDALRTNSNFRKTQYRSNWFEERLCKILQRRDRAGARVRRGYKLRSMNHNYLAKTNAEFTAHNDLQTTLSGIRKPKAFSNCDGEFCDSLFDDFRFIHFNQNSYSKAAKFCPGNSNFSSKNSICDSAKLISPMKDTTCKHSYNSSKNSLHGTHYSGSQSSSSQKQYTSNSTQRKYCNLVHEDSTSYFVNSGDHISPESFETENYDLTLRKPVFQKELIGLQSNSDSNNSFSYRDNILQIKSEINHSNLPFIYGKKYDAICLPHLECRSLFFKTPRIFPNFYSWTYSPIIDTNYPKNLDLPSNKLYSKRLFNRCVDHNCEVNGRVNQENNSFIDKSNTQLSNEIDIIPRANSILQQSNLIMIENMCFEKIDYTSHMNNSRNLITNDHMRELFLVCDNVIVRYKMMGFFISSNEIFDQILIFSFLIFNIINGRLHFELLRLYRQFLPKLVGISSNILSDFEFYLDKFTISDHLDIIVESSLLLRYYFPSEKNDKFLNSALLDKRFKLYWIIIFTFAIKYGKPLQTIIPTILERLRSDTHENNRLQLAKLIGLIKVWEFDSYNLCYNFLSQLLWEDPSRNVRNEIGNIILEIGMSKEILRDIFYHLDHEDKLIRLRAVKSLGSFNVSNSRCIRKLLEILEIDSSVAVKLETIKTLSILSIHEPRIKSILVEKSRGEGFVALEAQKVLKILQ